MRIVSKWLAPLALLAVAGVPVLAHASLAAGKPKAAPKETLPTIVVSMNGRSISVRGSLQSGAVDIRSVTTEKKSGTPVLLRLNPGVTYKQVFAYAASHPNPDLNRVSLLAPLVFDADAPRGTSNVQTTLQAGQYVALDVSGPSKKQPPTTTFSISPAVHPATLPTPHGTYRSLEFGFRGPRILHVGELLRVHNNGYLVHMIVGIRARSKQGAVVIKRLLKAGKDHQAQHLATGFVDFADPISHGATMQLVVRARRGYYVMACFMDAQDGREHSRLGMLRLFRIK